MIGNRRANMRDGMSRHNWSGIAFRDVASTAGHGPDDGLVPQVGDGASYRGPGDTEGIHQLLFRWNWRPLLQFPRLDALAEPSGDLPVRGQFGAIVDLRSIHAIKVAGLRQRAA